MKLDQGLDLTYCTNIHAADGWDDVRQNLERYCPALKARISPHSPFGIGLRLSAAEATELADPLRLREFRAFLDDQDLYVALLNGFPFGSFHNRSVKAQVFAPDWRDPRRVHYTLRLLEILKQILPSGEDGGISTLPLSYKPWVALGKGEQWRTIVGNLVTVVVAMVRAEQETGQHIHLDIEPEPGGLVENSKEFIDFFQGWLLPVGAPLLALQLRVAEEEAASHLRNHICVCFDTCHFAVEFDEAESALASLEAAGIRIGRVQISSALEIDVPEDAEGREHLRAALARFADPIYLHQVVEQNGGGTCSQYADLPEALASLTSPGSRCRRWRVHFHVPLFTPQYTAFGSTQHEIGKVFRRLEQKSFTRHLEIETYTWNVLPEECRNQLLDSIEQEYRWVLDQVHVCAKQ